MRKPGLSLFDVREEAMMWTLEDRPHSTNVVRSRKLVGGDPDEVAAGTDMADKAQTDLTTTLQDVVKIIAQQGKAISELTNAVRDLTIHHASSERGTKEVRFKIKPKYTDDGQPICLRCEGVGHMARHCNRQRDAGGSSNLHPNPAVQGNRNPPLL